MLKIEMPIEQAKLAAEACHFYGRMLNGDYQAVIDLCLDKISLTVSMNLAV